VTSQSLCDFSYDFSQSAFDGNATQRDEVLNFLYKVCVAGINCRTSSHERDSILCEGWGATYPGEEGVLRVPVDVVAVCLPEGGVVVHVVCMFRATCVV
jgi:hypothetical protein